jgi:NAD-dependent deacetylase
MQRRRVFVLTGAGVSAESGLGTFRDKDEIRMWARFVSMTLATPEAFARDPDQCTRSATLVAGT